MRANRRAWVWGESGLALITSALVQAGCLASRSAAAFAPAKFGIRPSAPGKRDTPSRSMARQTSRLTSSFVRMSRDRNVGPGGPGTIGRMAENGRTTLSMRDREPALRAGRPLPAVRPEELREHLPGVEPERQLTDWGRSERVEG